MKNIPNNIGRVGIFALALCLSNCRQHCVQSERCGLAPDPGPCFGDMPRYYYDKEEKRCKQFTYGGCEGVVPFETLEACQQCECK